MLRAKDLHSARRERSWGCCDVAERDIVPGLTLRDDGAVRIVRLDRGVAGNTITSEMHRGLLTTFQELSDNPAVRCVVLTGTGDSFCLGGDVTWVHGLLSDPALEVHAIAQDQRIIHAIQGCSCPVLAAVNGPAVGLGCSLALACDLVLLSETAQLVDPHVSRGLVAGDGGAVFMPALMPFMQAKRYLFTGDPVDAATAVQLGLAIATVQPGELMTEALALAHRLAEQPSYALQQTKRAVNLHLRDALGSVAAYASQTELVSLDTTDFRELIEARLKAGSARGEGPQRFEDRTVEPRLPPAVSTNRDIDASIAAAGRHTQWNATLAHNPELYRALQPLIAHLLKGLKLPHRDRELLILRRAWLAQCAYQWVAHVRVARGIGMTDEEIERITRGPADVSWSNEDRSVLVAVDQLTSTGRLSDATWESLAARYSQAQLVEFPAVVGAYAMLGYAQTVFRVRPADELDDRLSALVPFG